MDVELHILPLAKTSKFVTKEEKKRSIVNFVCVVKSTIHLYRTSNSPSSPLNELLEDLPSQTVTDLHYVWLQRDRHININSSSCHGTLSNYVIMFLQLNTKISLMSGPLLLFSFLGFNLVMAFLFLPLKQSTFREMHIYFHTF